MIYYTIKLYHNKAKQTPSKRSVCVMSAYGHKIFVNPYCYHQIKDNFMAYIILTKNTFYMIHVPKPLSFTRAVIDFMLFTYFLYLPKSQINKNFLFIQNILS